MDDLGSPRQTLQWAKKRIAELDTALGAFCDEKPWSYVVEPDIASGQFLHKIAFTDRITEFLPNLVADAANNLRSVLDQIGFAVAVARTKKADPKHAQFPFGDDVDGVENAIVGRKVCRDLPPEIVDFCRQLRPYKGGNDTLWALNKLANTPKHKTIVPMFVGGGLP